MSKWIIREPESNFGYPVAKITVHLKDKILKGYVQDCDGDFYSWSVYEGEERKAGGETDDIETDNNGPIISGWDIALDKASYFIATGKEKL